MQRMREIAWTAGVAVLAGTAAAWADIGDPAIVFEATSSAGTGSYTVALEDGAWDGSSWFWMAPEPIEILSASGELILTLTQGSAFFDGDPVIGLGFAVLAGGSDTVFSVSSATVSFPTIFGAQGRASGGLTVTESNGDTATLTGLLAAGGAFQADTDLGLFASLLAGPFSPGGAFGTIDAIDEFPGGGAFVAIGDVSEISTDWSFELSANDQASGTSVFVVVPTPASLAMLAVGGLVVGRRRR